VPGVIELFYAQDVEKFHVHVPRQGISSDGSLYMKFSGILQNVRQSTRLWAEWRLQFWNELR